MHAPTRMSTSLTSSIFSTVEDYLAHVRELLDHDDFSEEKALVALHRHDYDANGALASLLVDPEPFHKGLCHFPPMRPHASVLMISC